MIRYALKCAEGHIFESWFQNADAYDALVKAGHVTCVECGTAKVEKSLMAPRVTTDKAAPPAEPAQVPSTPLAPQSDVERQIAELKAKVEAESDYVGMNFATEARAMHEGTAPERAIYGEAKPEDALSLLEDGVPVAPLPFAPSRKTN